MSTNDIKLIIWVLIVILLLHSLLSLWGSTKATIAYVYYDNELIEKIDLKIDKEYEVKGYNGKVTIEVLNNKIRVTKEKSPLNLCSHQGFVDKNNQVIVCLPNKIIIKIKNEKDSIDAIVR